MLIYKLVSREEWDRAVPHKIFHGAPVDTLDGFIHFSTADQVHETAARHFSGKGNLLLVAVDTESLGAALRFEPSRGGALFPHLYGPLAFENVVFVKPLPLIDGQHFFDGLLA